MIIINNTRSKSFSMKSIMKSGKMVDALKEALDAPVGSTKRKQARAMISSLAAVKNNHMAIEDGQGGFMDSPMMNDLRNAGNRISGWANNVASTASNAWNAAGNTTSQIGNAFQTGAAATGNAITNTSYNVGRGITDYTGITTPPPPPPTPGQYQTMNPQGSTVVIRGFDLPSNGSNMSMASSPNMSMAPKPGAIIDPNSADGRALAYANSPEGYKGKSAEQMKAETDARYAGYAANAAGTSSTGTGASGTGVSGTDSTGTGTNINTTNPMQKWVDAGVGKLTGQMAIQSDMEQLRLMFPTWTDEQLESVSGSSAARQVGNLREALKTEYNITGLLNKVTDLTNRNLNVQPTLEAYVKEKDQYLKNLDAMIDGLNDYRATNDTSDPRTQRQIKMYDDYLTTLKGRTTLRYADYVKTSVDQAKNELTAADNNYKTQLALFEDQFKIESDIAVEEYNNLKEMLQEMYTNLDGQYENSLDIATKEANLLKINQSISTDALDNSTRPSDDKFTASDQSLYNSWLGLDDKYEDIPGQEKSSDLYSLMGTAASKGLYSNEMREEFMKNVRRQVIRGASSGSLSDNIKFYNETASKIGQYAAYDTTVNSKEDLKNTQYGYDIDTITSNLYGGISSGLATYFSQADKASQLKTDVRDLLGVGIFNIKEKAKEKFIGSGDKNNDIKNALWDMWEIKLKTGNSDFFDTYKNSDSDEDVAANFASAYASWMGQLYNFQALSSFDSERAIINSQQ